MTNSVRDNLADYAYFTQLSDNWRSHLTESLTGIDRKIQERGKKAVGPIMTLVNTSLLLAEIAYSRGDSMDEIQARVQTGLGYLRYLPDLYRRYPELEVERSSFLKDFRHLYFASVFNVNEQTSQLVGQEVDFYKRTDPIILFLRSTLTEEIPQTGEISEIEFPYLYERLGEAVLEPNADACEEVLYHYLTNWYSDLDADKETSGIGIGSHKKMIRYRGYWCWEAAAIAVARGIDDTRMRDHEHYPTDLADWARNTGR